MVRIRHPNRVDITNIAVQLYKGIHNVEVECDIVVNSNREKLKELSKEIAVANNPFFQEKLKQKLSAKAMEYIKQVDLSKEEPFTDRYGRCTTYYTEIADQRIWLYQPGTVMLESGVIPGELEVCHGGSQQNGGILGNGCATFLEHTGYK